jgi:hypothetical protein
MARPVKPVGLRMTQLSWIFELAKKYDYKPEHPLLLAEGHGLTNMLHKAEAAGDLRREVVDGDTVWHMTEKFIAECRAQYSPRAAERPPTSDV